MHSEYDTGIIPAKKRLQRRFDLNRKGDRTMGYFLLSLQAVIFSFGGLLIKSAGTAFSPYMISSLRFVIGISLLLLCMKCGRGDLRLVLTNPVIIFGGICKAVHYLGENIGVMQGASYGGVLIWPVQTLAVFLASIFIFKERATIRNVLGSFLCISGIVLISWNGVPLAEFFAGSFSSLVAFILAGIGASGFGLAQKQLIQKMDNAKLNCSMFLYGWLVTLPMLPFTGPHIEAGFNAAGLACTIILGTITCFGFLMQGAALKTVPLFIATLIQSSTVVLTILWGVLFYGDPISGYVVVGAALFLAGIIIVNLHQRRKKA